MARRKSEKRAGGTKSRKNKNRQTTVGKIQSMLDVRSEGQFGEMMERINSGPLTIIFAYANWCGHCTDFAPHFNKAANSSKRSVQAIKINDTVLPSANEYIAKNTSKNAKPLNNITGYPSVILVDNEGSLVTNVEPVKDTKRLENFMKKSGNIIEQAQAPSLPPVPLQNIDKQSTTQLSTAAATPEQNTFFSPSPVEITEDPNTSIENTVPVSVPNYSEDTIHPLRQPQGPLVGGSLFDALSSTATALAPTGILLALASQMIKKRSNRSSPFSRKQRRFKHQRRTKTMRQRSSHK